MTKNHLIVVPTLRRGGAERVASVLADGLGRYGKSTIVVFDGRDVAYKQKCDVIDLGLPAASGVVGKVITRIKRTVSLRRILRSVNPDKVIGIMDAANVAMLLACKGSGVSCIKIASVHNSPHSFSYAMQMQAKIMYASADYIAALTNDAADQMVNDWHLPKNKVLKISNPLSGDFFIPSTEQRIPGLVFGCGRLVGQKRFDRLIRSFSRLPSHIYGGNPIELCIAGQGDMLCELKGLALSLGVSSRVHFLGEQENVMSWYDKCSVFVLSSDYEGFPMTLAEAMARGCPVISTKCRTGPMEMIDDGLDGLLVGQFDEHLLTIALNKVLFDGEFGRRLGSAARNKAMGWHVDELAKYWSEI